MNASTPRTFRFVSPLQFALIPMTTAFTPIVLAMNHGSEVRRYILIGICLLFIAAMMALIAYLVKSPPFLALEGHQLSLGRLVVPIEEIEALTYNQRNRYLCIRRRGRSTNVQYMLFRKEEAPALIEQLQAWADSHRVPFSLK